jgi:hypothetical protein
MGGSGSSGGWAPSAPSNPCDRINFRAVINSPKPIVNTLKLQDVLDVRLQTLPVLAVVVELRGTVVGALTGAQVNSLVNCLQNGYTYTATVVAIAGGSCTVQVSAT